ncbi:MAG: nucleotidyltransferase domain-containing protein [Acidobacteriota bacterium]
MKTSGLSKNLESILAAMRQACIETYGERLVTVAVYGSVGRGTAGPDSDVDVLVVADSLPQGRTARIKEFVAVEKRFAQLLRKANFSREPPFLSPVFKTRGSVRQGSPLFFDMTQDARILFDRQGFFTNELSRLRKRLRSLGAKRIWQGSAWYWDLKPDYRPGEEFEI